MTPEELTARCRSLAHQILKSCARSYDRNLDITGPVHREYACGRVEDSAAQMIETEVKLMMKENQP